MQAVQNGVGLAGVKAHGRGVAGGVLQYEADVHPTARGKAPDDLFKAWFKTAHSKGKTPLEIKMAAVDAFDFPLLDGVGIFNKAAAKAGHAA